MLIRLFLLLCLLACIYERTEAVWGLSQFADITHFRLTLPLSPGIQQCFFETFKKGHTAYFSTLTVGGVKDMMSAMEVKTPYGIILYPNQWNVTHRFNVVLQEDGDYSICIMSPSSSDTQARQIVGVSGYHKDQFDKALDEYKAEANMSGEIHNTISNAYSKVYGNLETSLALMSEGRKHWATDFYMLRSNLSWIDRWSVLQGMAIMATGGFQVFFLRLLFRAPKTTRSGNVRA